MVVIVAPLLICAVAIVALALADLVRMEKKTPRNLCFPVVVLTLAACVPVYFYLASRAIPFDADAWRKAEPGKRSVDIRYRMFRDLIRQLDEKRPHFDEVRELLGPPGTTNAKTRRWPVRLYLRYRLGHKRWGPMRVPFGSNVSLGFDEDDRYHGYSLTDD